MLKDKLIGIWRLVSAEFERSDGEMIYLYGKSAQGMLIYEPGGEMSVHIMNPERPNFQAGDSRSGTPQEIQTAFDGYIGYYGEYIVNEAEGSVIHRVQGSHFPNWVGRDQVRYFQFSGRNLILTTPPMQVGGASLTGRLVWERQG